MVELLWQDGSFLPLSEGRIHPEDRGFQFADGIYEVVACYDGKPLLLEEHLERFDASAAGLLLAPTIARAERAAIIRELARRSGIAEAMVYGQLTRGAARRSHVFPAPDTPPTELWYVRALPRYTPEQRRDGVSLLTVPDERWANCHWKTVSLLPNCLAKEKAKRAGCFEALLIAEDGTVRETSAANVFAVIEGEVRTHPLTRAILPGVTRRFYVREGAALGFPVHERAFSISELAGASEVFLTSTTMGAMGVTKIDGKAIGNGVVGPVTRAFAARMESEIAKLRARANHSVASGGTETGGGSRAA